MSKTIKYKGVLKDFKKVYQITKNGVRVGKIIEFKNGVAKNIPDEVATQLCKNDLYSVVTKETTHDRK